MTMQCINVLPQAFTPNNVKVLEYHEDLKYFYQNSYGSGINSRLTCSLVVDMLNHLESQTNPKVSAYFTHSATMFSLLTALGAYKDNDGIRADNYQQMMQRKWRSSEVSPFASNLAVIKYGKCTAHNFFKNDIQPIILFIVDCPLDNERNKVLFLLNQKPLYFNWCNIGLCDWTKVRQMYGSFKQHDCLTTYCTGDAPGIVPTFTLLLIAVIGSIIRSVV